MKRALGVLLRALGWVLGVCAVLSALLCFGQEWLVELPVVLVLGWFWFLERVLPEVTFRWDAIAETVVVGVVLGVGSHQLLRRLWAQWHAGEAEARPWPARWSVSLVALIVLLFCATMATVGIGHQVGWLVSGRAPVLESSWRFFRLERDNTRLCERALEYSRLGVTDGRMTQVLLRATDTQDEAERLYVVPRRGPGGEAGFLVFPRDPVTREQAGAVRCGGGLKEAEPVVAAELSRLLSEGRVAAGTAP